jgi:hypothetical protein
MDHIKRTGKKMQKRAFLRVGLLAVGAATAATATTSRAAVYSANADAEIRENQPEFTRGFGAPAVSGQQTELQLSQIESNRNLSLIRISLPLGTTAGDLGGYASLRTMWRSNATSNFGTGGGSVRLYALDPSHAQNTTWDEQNVFYRDAGSHQQVNVNPGTGQSLTTPSVLAQPSIAGLTPEFNDPPAPIAGFAGYGANPTHAQRAPGIVFDNAPYSQQVQNENQARYQYNLDQRALGAGGEAYLPYINQPAYGIRQAASARPVTNAISTGDGDPFTTTDGYANVDSDIPESNRPWDSGPTNSYVDDLDPVAYQLLGYAKLTGTWTGQLFIDFGDSNGTDTTPSAHELSIRANLISYLTNGLNAGYTDFTFLLGRGLGTLDFDGDTVMDDVVSGTAVHLAAKEFAPLTGGNFAAQLIIAPEPGSATLAILGLVTALGVRRRTR